MSVRVTRGTLDGDDELKVIRDALQKYMRANPKSKISLYRRGEYLVRVRVIDAQFEGLSMGQRQKRIWKYLETIPEEILGDISMLLCLTPKEVPTSAGNMEFEHPVPFAFA